MRSPALISACLKAGCHAVLASLSGRYPPLEGRSPTCYSPVCHSTQGRSPFRVRLACVRHAASVDSEPGSNSQVKFVVPPEGGSNLLTLIACLNRLSNVVQFVKLYRWFAARAPLVNYTCDTQSSIAIRIASIAAPPADTRRASTVAPFDAPADKVLARSI